MIGSSARNLEYLGLLLEKELDQFIHKVYEICGFASGTHIEKVKPAKSGHDSFTFIKTVGLVASRPHVDSYISPTSSSSHYNSGGMHCYYSSTNRRCRVALGYTLAQSTNRRAKQLAVTGF